LDDFGHQSAGAGPAAMLSAAVAVRIALGATPGVPERVDLATEHGCLVWSIEVDCGDPLPVVVLVDAGSGRISHIERGGISTAWPA